jgi:adenylylsulfate kinase
MAVPTLLLTGTIGAGKTAVAAEIGDLLADLRIPNAAIDLDALVWQWPSSSEWNSDLMFENLAALWTNYQAHGSTHLVLARVVESALALERYREAVPDAEIVVCRLSAPERDCIERLMSRMPEGPRRDWHIARTHELGHTLDRLGIEDFVVENTARSLRSTAVEVLSRAGWISGIEWRERT